MKGSTLKIAVMAVNEPRSINPRQAQKRTFTQTEITGVLVTCQILCIYFENGNISSTINLVHTNKGERSGTSGQSKQCPSLSL